MVIESGECHPLALFTSRADAELHANRKNDIGLRNCELVPLYRQPTLTDAEREAIDEAIFTCECAALSDKADPDDQRREENTVSTLRALLERAK